MNNSVNSFESASSHSESQERRHRRPQKNFRCQICLKRFSSKHCLKEHGYTHTNEKPYKCAICLIPFKHASQLSVHKKGHRITYEFKYPKLTHMLESYKKTLPTAQISIEIVNIPLISVPQAWVLPTFN